MFLVKKEDIKKHKGELLDSIVRNSGMTIKAVAKAAGYDRTSYYNHILEPQLPYKIISRYGEALRHDFSNEYPEEKATRPTHTKEITTFEEMEKDRDYWRERFFRLTEKVADSFKEESSGEI